eukprot:TRINITY_DN8021_c0_g1_i1.p2 TRINITY_DN8021_c0_g1~~TRINITY_DN8021_c0_g1_i1.p2  ORF type:complete len:308 (+),score=92.76 TRINITY_DN8021_c0_g1_i1:84-1007(+)
MDGMDIARLEDTLSLPSGRLMSEGGGAPGAWHRQEDLTRRMMEGLDCCEAEVWRAEYGLETSGGDPADAAAAAAAAPAPAEAAVGNQAQFITRECVNVNASGRGRGGGIYHGTPAWFASLVPPTAAEAGRGGLGRNPRHGHVTQPQYSRAPPTAPEELYLLSSPQAPYARRDARYPVSPDDGAVAVREPSIQRTRPPPAAAIKAPAAPAPKPRLRHEAAWNNSTATEDRYPKKKALAEGDRPRPMYSKGERAKSAQYYQHVNWGRYTPEQQGYLAAHREMAHRDVLPQKRTFKANLFFRATLGDLRP